MTQKQLVAATADLEPWQRLGLPGGPRATTQLRGNGEVTAAALIPRGTFAIIVGGCWMPAHSQAAAAISTLWMSANTWVDFQAIKERAKNAERRELRQNSTK